MYNYFKKSKIIFLFILAFTLNNNCGFSPIYADKSDVPEVKIALKNIYVAPIEDEGEIFFGSLKIIANTCKKSPPEEPPENYAFLEIWEVTDDAKDKTNKKIFSGWMFSSSPSISALEHAVYDIWIIDCNV